MAFGHEGDGRRRRRRVRGVLALATSVGMGWLLQRRLDQRRPQDRADVPANGAGMRRVPVR